MAVEHIKINKIGEAKPVKIGLLNARGLRHVVRISYNSVEICQALARENIVYLAYPDNVEAVRLEYIHRRIFRVIREFEQKTGRKVLCNKPYSGTEVIKDYGEEHLKTGALIVYTSADSVFQIAAHESIVPPELLYDYCRIARKILCGKNGVGRVIARPFTGEYPFTRTPRRHDFSIDPPSVTMCDLIKKAGQSCISVGKIYDIFAGRGITESNPMKGNDDGMDITLKKQGEDFEGLCFTNLVDFDMLYGHRQDVDGYAAAYAESALSPVSIFLAMRQYS